MEPQPRRRKKSTPAGPLPIIGWREWLALPDLGIAAVKAKIDTGARSSSLHVVHIEPYRQDGREFVRFKVHPLQRDSRTTVTATAEVLEFRRIRSSSGHATLRPVILTPVEVLGQRWKIELTLANRDEMGFRMLLGREAVRRRFLVDPGASYCDSSRVPGPRRKRRSDSPAKRPQA
ncbi:MAG: ATP-dependent zinc protease [Maioricimonas sp. JB049]